MAGLGVPAGPGRHLGQRSRKALARLSLRARLLVGLVVLAAVGLFVADVVVYGSIRSYLNDQVTSELEAATSTLTQFRCGPDSAPYVRGLPFGAAVEVVSLGGSPVCSVPGTFRLSGIPAVSSLQNGAVFNAPAAGSLAGSYRVLPTDVNLDGGLGPSAVALVAIPLSPLGGTLHRLLIAEVAVSLAVLAALAAVGTVVVRVGLRPLEQMEETAAAIAAGDLSRRVEDDDEHTEVGRLGRSLNVMLSTIEQSFAEQQASEFRLRQFLADASHELRTPVTSIRGYAELFRRGAAERPDDLALAMRRIEEEARRMGGLVEDLLLLARLDQGRPPEQAPVDLSLIATDAAADAQVLEPDRPVSVAVVEPVVVLGDEQRLRQVVSNLVQNALRHTPGEVPVEVSVQAVGSLARLAVRDEGPGIAPEHAKRIFERFYRADPSRTRGSGGSGLGLSIVASIARAHGGVAYVDTEPGRGATFVVDLPLAPRDPGGAPPTSESAVGPERAGSLDGLVEVGGVVEPAKDPPSGHDHDRRDGSVVGADKGKR